MHEVGDYIYLVIIIIAALSGIFKKKKEKSLSIPIPERKTRSFDEILQEMLPSEVEDTTVPRPISTPLETTFESKPIMTYENTTDFSTLKAQKHINRELTNNQIRENKKIADEELVNEGLKIELCNPDDARKAFIYSEIFNKKY